MKELYIETKYGKMYLQIYNEDILDNDLFFLHGWGSNLEAFSEIIKEVKKYRVICVDFLGFGRSEEPKEVIGLDEYVQSIATICEKIDSRNITLIGHSFGGRVAIRYASLYQCKYVVLISSKAFKNKSFKYYKKIIFYKIKKWVLKVFSFSKYLKYISIQGSEDYKKASVMMKKVMKKIIRNDLKNELKMISSKTIILGSVYDEVVNYDETLKIYELINDSVLYPFYKSNHYLFISEKDKALSILKKEIDI